MATKTNASVALDRESVETCLEYTVAVLGTVEGQKGIIHTNVAWLLDEANLSGGDAQGFQEAARSVEEISTKMQKKFEVLRNSVAKLLERYGGASSVNKVKMEEAVDKMSALTQKVRQTKQA